MDLYEETYIKIPKVWGSESLQVSEHMEGREVVHLERASLLPGGSSVSLIISF